MKWIEPLGPITGRAALSLIGQERAIPLAGGDAAFAWARLVDTGAVVPVRRVPPGYEVALANVATERAAWAGLPTDRVSVMGILNMTPDSFSDGGRHADAGAAIAAGLALADEGADIVDVGGESTRPGAEPVQPEIERERTLPVVKGLARAGVKVSIDTRNASTMAAALDVGATIVNDVSALRHDPESLALVARRGCDVVLMHMRGTPLTMRDLAHYDDVALDVARELAEAMDGAVSAGIDERRIAIDPGFGFAKTSDQNVELIQRLPLLLNLGARILAGVSRKSSIGRIAGVSDPAERLAGSLAAMLAAVAGGATIVRVHDVAETVQALRVWKAATCG